MRNFTAFLRGEDNTEFTVSVDAKNTEAAFDEVEERYPDATILELTDSAQRAKDVYDRAQQAYENDYYYDD